VITSWLMGNRTVRGGRIINPPFGHPEACWCCFTSCSTKADPNIPLFVDSPLAFTGPGPTVPILNARRERRGISDQREDLSGFQRLQYPRLPSQKHNDRRIPFVVVCPGM
jgi:hypothetical protein